MTTAPTPEEVRALAERLEHCVAKWGKQDALSLEAYSSVKMLRRLQTENERLRTELVAEARTTAEQKLRADQLAQQHRMQAQMHAQANEELAEEVDATDNWRRLALQFDGHRIQAMWHLRALLDHPMSHVLPAREFLDAPPLSGEAVLAQRIAELEARKPLPPTDMTVTQHVNALVGDGLTAQKVEAICEREPYDVTGVVLSLPDGRACIVNLSAVRWFHGACDFWELLHGGSS